MISGLCSCLCRCLCPYSCYETCCETKDTWNITDEILPGEYGAGFLYKKAKSSMIWSKRFFVLTPTKLLYYQTSERSEATLKGEIVIAGAKASVSNRQHSRKHYYFQIEHRVCGSREFYAKSRNKMNQWINKINDMSLELSKTLVYGNLSKQGGGLTKTGWSSRWCIVVLNQFDYFEKASDNQSKGSITLTGAKVKEINIKGMPYCFELTASTIKKGTKKYVFSTVDESERKKFMNAITYGSTVSIKKEIDNSSSNSPMHNKTESTSTDKGSIEMQNMNTISSERDSISPYTHKKPKEKSGFLLKKSPSMFAGFQLRFFRIENSGELLYYEDDKSNEAKGKLNLAKASIELYGKTDIVVTCGTTGRPFHLRASSYIESQHWNDTITEWILYLDQE